MRICLVGKYPPIQGGVSAQHFWLARELAERGETVHVVTNAAEVEQAYRLHLRPVDSEWLDAGGRIAVHSTEPPDRRYTHIPESNPFVTKLASLAVKAIEEADLEVVAAYYFEPYAVAGFLAATLTGRPLVVRHAGSDAGRLLHVPQLGPTYAGILRRADVVTAGPASAGIFRGLGVLPERIQPQPGFVLPRAHFCPDGIRLDLDEVLAELAGSSDWHWRTDPVDSSRPMIGIYGKIGRRKGLYDLISVLGQLKREGLSFHLIALCHGTPAAEEALREALLAADIEVDTRVLPFVPHWRIPEFLRAMTAVCYLENRFPILAHAPGIPREVLSCGTALVVSEEVARKQPFRSELTHKVNALIVGDPEDHEELAAAVREVLHDPAGAARMGSLGVRLLPADLTDQPVDRWQAIFRLAASSADRAVDASDRSQAVASSRYFSATRRLLPADVVAAADRAAASVEPDVAPLVFAETLAPAVSPVDQQHLVELFRWELLQVPANGTGAGPSHFNRLPVPALGVPPTTVPPDARPVISDGVCGRSFGFDMAELARRASKNGGPLDVGALRGEHYYAFLRSGRPVRVLSLGPLHHQLLPLCDGSRTAADIAHELAWKPDNRATPDAVGAAMLDLLLHGVLDLHTDAG